MTHCMLDLETMGNGHDAAIVSIGAATFDPYTNVAPVTFYVNVDLASNIPAQRTLDPSTIYWWMKQSDEAREALVSAPLIPLSAALTSFYEFYKRNKAEHLWAHAIFDPVIMASAYRACSLKMPWHYRDVRDIRTLNMLYTELTDEPHRLKVDPAATKGTAHNALDDALYQVAYVREMMQYLKTVAEDYS